MAWRVETPTRRRGAGYRRKDDTINAGLDEIDSMLDALGGDARRMNAQVRRQNSRLGVMNEAQLEEARTARVRRAAPRGPTSDLLCVSTACPRAAQRPLLAAYGTARPVRPSYCFVDLCGNTDSAPRGRPIMFLGRTPAAAAASHRAVRNRQRNARAASDGVLDLTIQHEPRGSLLTEAPRRPSWPLASAPSCRTDTISPPSGPAAAVLEKANPRRRLPTAGP